MAAPAGYGKTTAVRDWSVRQDTALAWVTLDAGDDDPVRLWRHVATAVDRVRPGLGHRALQRLTTAGDSIQDVVDELLNGVAAFGARMVIVLDDLHAVQEADCLESLDYALSQLPANARVIVISRADPALRLARLRANGTLDELRAAVLAFTPEEAYELLVAREQLELGQEEIDTLVAQTEGWPAALVLAAHWLKSVDDPVRAVGEFGGDHHFVAEYLSGEVIASLGPERRSFLLAAAVLGEFTPDLCDAVLGRSDSAVMLAEIEQANLFVLRLERSGWHRIHSLFAEYARAQLASEQPELAACFNRRAAEWLRAQGFAVEAVAHASAAGDHELVAELLAEYHLEMIKSGTARTLLHWVRTLPDDVIVKQPELAAFGALAAINVGGSTLELRRYLEIADEALRAGDGTRSESTSPAAHLFEVEVLVAHALAIDRGVRQAVRDGRKAVELAHDGLAEATSGALTAYARALYFAGDLEQAAAVAARVLEDPKVRQRVPALMHAHTTLALVDVERGRLLSARGHAAKAKAAVRGIRTSRSWLGGNAAAALGVVLAAEGHLVEAEHELVRAGNLFDDHVPTLHYAWLLVLLADVRIRRGHLAEAESTLRSAQDALDRLPDSGRVPSMADMVEQELDAATARARSGEVLEPPSEAELAVLRLLPTDLSTREIGESLFLSPNTIRSHRRVLYQKLGVHDRAAAVARATALGLLAQVESPG